MEYEKDYHQETGFWGALFFSWLGASLVTLLFAAFTEAISLPNIVLIFLLVTFLLAFKLGKKAAWISAILNVAYFDFFFVPPRLSFNVENTQYLITFLVMLIVGLLTGHLVARLRQRVEEIQNRQAYMEGLQQFAQRLLAVNTLKDITCIAQSMSAEILGIKTAVYLENEQSLSNSAEDFINPSVKSWCLQSGIKVDEDEGRDKVVSVTYQPIKQNLNIFGVMIAIDNTASLRNFGKREIIGMAANLIAMAVVRLKTQENEQLANLLMEKEKLKNAILSSLSHDIRTPLTVMIANADGLLADAHSSELDVKNGLKQIRNQGMKLSQLVGDLVELSKLQLNEPTIKKSLQPVEEVIGSSIAHFKLSHPGRIVVVEIGPKVEPISFDEVLIERVICNLLENSARASAEEALIEIRVKRLDGYIEFSIVDSGSGLSINDDAHMDQDKRSGLGLIIVKAILASHNGTISLANREDAQGAIASFTLPI